MPVHLNLPPSWRSPGHCSAPRFPTRKRGYSKTTPTRLVTDANKTPRSVFIDQRIALRWIRHHAMSVNQLPSACRLCFVAVKGWLTASWSSVYGVICVSVVGDVIRLSKMVTLPPRAAESVYACFRQRRSAFCFGGTPEDADDREKRQQRHLSALLLGATFPAPRLHHCHGGACALGNGPTIVTHHHSAGATAAGLTLSSRSGHFADFETKILLYGQTAAPPFTAMGRVLQAGAGYTQC